MARLYLFSIFPLFLIFCTANNQMHVQGKCSTAELHPQPHMFLENTLSYGGDSLSCPLKGRPFVSSKYISFQ